MPNSWLKEVNMASPVLHTFGLARILREPCADVDPVLATFRSIWLKHYEAYLKPESVKTSQISVSLHKAQASNNSFRRNSGN